jgi:mannose/fructose/N-acetylgalactosamine-specific phosphotransferase system component IID
MAGLKGRLRTLVRLLGIQATWNYERMQGVSMGYAAEPLLRALFANDPERYRQALSRGTGFFNANPYLAPAAIGAEVRAETDGVPAPQIERLRSALSGPLGALGDRLFWSGLVPALASAALTLLLLGSGPWPVLAFVLALNTFRLALAPWLLSLGWEHGLKVGGALARSQLPRFSVVAESAAAFLGALAIPLVARRYLAGAALESVAGVVVVILGALLLRRKALPTVSPMAMTLVVALGVLLWHWGLD